MRADRITRAEARKILGIHAQTMTRAIDAGVFELIDDPSGQQWIKRQGLEEAWANRPRQRIRKSSGPPPPPRPSRPSPGGGLESWEFPSIPSPGEVPRLEEQKGHTEFIKRYRELMALKREADLLVYRADVEAAQAAVNMQLLSRAQSIPIQYKSRFPELTDRQIEVLEDMILQIFEDTANDSFEDLSDD